MGEERDDPMEGGIEMIDECQPSLPGSPKRSSQRKVNLLEKGFQSEPFNFYCSFMIIALNIYLLYLALFNKHFLAPLDVDPNSSNVAMANFDALSVFTLFVLLFSGIAAGYIARLCRLPGLLGMLLVGIFLKNTFEETLFVYNQWGVFLRRTAFVVILLRGGLSLDGEALKRMKGACLRLCFLPCSAEAIVVAVASRFILGLSWLFALLLGFVLAAVSPAVVVPAMLEAQQQGYGVAAGIPTLVVAAASLDDVYAITMFSIFLSLIFSTGDNVWLTLIRSPVEVISGLFFGIICGKLLQYFPSKNEKNPNLIRCTLLVSMSLTWLFGTIALKIDSIGAIAVLVMAFVAGTGWKKDGPLVLEDYLGTMWRLIFEPFLFTLIGFELSFSMISLYIVGWGLIVLLLGLVFRTIVAILATSNAGLSMKEKLFVGVAWLPKATVQAALAPAALDIARSRSDISNEYLDYSITLFTVAVLSILTTAPIGAFIIRLCTPRLLKKD